MIHLPSVPTADGQRLGVSDDAMEQFYFGTGSGTICYRRMQGLPEEGRSMMEDRTKNTIKGANASGARNK